MENYFKSFFEKVRHTPKEFAVKYSQNNINTKVLNIYSLTLTFSTDFFIDIQPNQFHTDDSFTGNVVNVGGVIHYKNQRFIKRYFIKGHGKSWLTKDDSYLFHRPFGDYRESYSTKNTITPQTYLIEYFPLSEVIEKIRKVYINDLDKTLPFRVVESFQFENSDFKYTAEFFQKDI